VARKWRYAPDLRRFFRATRAVSYCIDQHTIEWWSRESNDPPRHAYKARILPIKLQDQKEGVGVACARQPVAPNALLPVSPIGGFTAQVARAREMRLCSDYG